ncbi:MAG: hypothetical protein I8H71_01450 [Xanthomonadaceae bacterium]|nr:hypothetical protein [Xanthomonadaceae bacterium]
MSTKIDAQAEGAKKLPAPRLQLRWEPFSEERSGYNWQCHYELVIPLDKFDIRAEQEGPRGGRRAALKELVVPIKPPSMRSTNGVPCTAPDGTRYYDAPYRDGAHAQWDAAVLGNPPIYVIAPDGRAFIKLEKEDA